MNKYNINNKLLLLIGEYHGKTGILSGNPYISKIFKRKINIDDLIKKVLKKLNIGLEIVNI